MAKNEVKVDFPNLPKGDVVAITGIGEVPNGATTKVDDFQMGQWEALTGQSWPDEGLIVPTPTAEPNPTGAQGEFAIQAAIRERQDARSEAEAEAEEAAVTKAVIRGEWPYPLMVDGKIVGLKGQKDPIVVADTPPKVDAKPKKENN